ncbi:MAG TPA: hypothetical protein VNQ73_09100 [Ilumatobacter sp.]|nr:hypothetical protein [Ilumatobacter sp.]
MSRPRKPYGNPPGRLAATMLKVLAAELSDGGRLTRGKQLWASDAVVDIVVGHGAVTAEVQGSRSQPYVVTVEAEPGEGTPRKADLWVQCTCPDDAGTGAQACKHAVATLFALSDEIAVEPTLLDRWRAGRRRDGARHVPERDPEPPPDNVRPLRLVRDTDAVSRPVSPPEPPPPDPSIGLIAAMLRGPAGPPTFPPPPDRDHPLPPGQTWAAALGSALAELKRLRWD